jgi:hypothetical protein
VQNLASVAWVQCSCPAGESVEQNSSSSSSDVRSAGACVAAGSTRLRHCARRQPPSCWQPKANKQVEAQYAVHVIDGNRHELPDVSISPAQVARVQYSCPAGESVEQNSSSSNVRSAGACVAAGSTRLRRCARQQLPSCWQPKANKQIGARYAMHVIDGNRHELPDVSISLVQEAWVQYSCPAGESVEQNSSSSSNVRSVGACVAAGSTRLGRCARQQPPSCWQPTQSSTGIVLQ